MVGPCPAQVILLIDLHARLLELMVGTDVGRVDLVHLPFISQSSRSDGHDGHRLRKLIGGVERSNMVREGGLWHGTKEPFWFMF